MKQGAADCSGLFLGSPEGMFPQMGQEPAHFSERPRAQVMLPSFNVVLRRLFGGSRGLEKIFKEPVPGNHGLGDFPALLRRGQAAAALVIQETLAGQPLKHVGNGGLVQTQRIRQVGDAGAVELPAGWGMGIMTEADFLKDASSVRLAYSRRHDPDIHHHHQYPKEKTP